MIAEIPSGNASLRDGSMKIMPFVRFDPDGEESPLHIISKKPKSGVRILTGAENFPASSRSDKLGFWVVGRYELPDDTYVKLFIQRHIKIAGFDVPRMHCLMLQFHELAPLWHMNIDLIPSDEAPLHLLTLRGRFNIIPPEQFEDRGFVLNGMTPIESFDPEDYERFITLHQKEKGTVGTAPPKVKEITGGKFAAVKRNRRRIIR